jgi:hypothetical protein
MRLTTCQPLTSMTIPETVSTGSVEATQSWRIDHTVLRSLDETTERHVRHASGIGSSTAGVFGAKTIKYCLRRVLGLWM